MWKKKEKIYLELLNFYLPLSLKDNIKTAVFDFHDNLLKN